MDNDAAFLLRFLNNGIRVLSSRILLIMTLLLTFGLFCWAMYLNDYFRIATATIFALLVFLPILGLDKKGGDSNVTRSD